MRPEERWLLPSVTGLAGRNNPSWCLQIRFLLASGPTRKLLNQGMNPSLPWKATEQLNVECASFPVLPGVCRSFPLEGFQRWSIPTIQPIFPWAKWARSHSPTCRPSFPPYSFLCRTYVASGPLVLPRFPPFSLLNQDLPASRG